MRGYFCIMSLTMLAGCGTVREKSVRTSGLSIRDLNRPRMLQKDTCLDAENKINFWGVKSTKTTVDGDFKTYSISTAVNESVGPQELPVCENSGHDTVDYVAQKSLVGIMEANTFSSSVFGYPLPPVKLLIHPNEQLIFDIRTNPLVLASNPVLSAWRDLQEGLSRVHITDNGSWNVKKWLDRTEFVISVYPQSEESHAANLLPLWESDFIIKHEYGHHMFYAAFANQIPDSQTLTSSKSFTSPKLPTQITVRDLISALSEGFSDLMGIYAGGDFQNIESSDCFGVNRDIISDRFADQYLKSFDDTTFSAIFHGTPVPSPNIPLEGCQSFIPQSPHHVGAILSHMFESLAVREDRTAIEKAQIAVSWVRLLGENFDDSRHGPAAFFELILKTQLEAIFGQKPLDMKACKILIAKAPIIWTDKNFTGFEQWISACSFQQKDQ